MCCSDAVNVSYQVANFACRTKLVSRWTKMRTVCKTASAPTRSPFKAFSTFSTSSLRRISETVLIHQMLFHWPKWNNRIRNNNGFNSDSSRDRRKRTKVLLIQSPFRLWRATTWWTVRLVKTGTTSTCRVQEIFDRSWTWYHGSNFDRACELATKLLNLNRLYTLDFWWTS